MKKKIKEQNRKVDKITFYLSLSAATILILIVIFFVIQFLINILVSISMR